MEKTNSCINSQFMHYCFTLNNYTESEVMNLREKLDSDDVRYAIFGFEKGEEGTPHLQGYVSFKKKKRFNGAKAFLGLRFHVERAKGSEKQNYDYCTKEGKFEEFGTRKTINKSRSDLEAFKDAVKDGNHDIKNIIEEHSEVYSKYPRFVSEYIRMHTPVPDLEYFPLRDWQADLNNQLKRAPDDRTITFVVDYAGKKGKSWFAKYYCLLHDNATLMRPMKHADMAYALPPNLRVLFLDCTRKQVEYLPYTFLEECKDGYVFSSKYESCMKRYDNMHVVVLMNQDPDMDALSKDRYNIINLN